MKTALNDHLNPFPTTSEIEGIPVAAFPNPHSLFERLVLEAKRPEQSVIHPVNVNAFNMAAVNSRYREILKASDGIYCDGAGVVLASSLLGNPLPTRLTAADWFVEMLGYFAARDVSVYLLGGKPGVAERALDVVKASVPKHSVVGLHHGYMLSSPALEQQVIDEINRLQPDILIVGFGTPLQELWIDDNRHRLTGVSTILPLGATMDFISGEVPRCPQWMGEAGFEWLYRFLNEPERLMERYVVGNPWFLGRILFQRAGTVLSQPVSALF